MTRLVLSLIEHAGLSFTNMQTPKDRSYEVSGQLYLIPFVFVKIFLMSSSK